MYASISAIFVLMNTFRLRCVPFGLGLFIIEVVLYRVVHSGKAGMNHRRFASLTLLFKFKLSGIKNPDINKDHVLNFIDKLLEQVCKSVSHPE